MKTLFEKKVVKFGGSSLASAEQFIKSANIINAEEARRYVVPSAPGKRFDGDTKVTDLLISCHAKSVSGGDWESDFTEIKSRYNDIIKGLGIATDLSGEFLTIEENLKNGTSLDYVASRGEHLNGIVLADYLGYEFIDAAENKPGFIKAMWCGDVECEDKLKDTTGGVKSRCIPFVEDHLSDKCVCCGKPAKHMVVWGRQY
jgi:aspartokinase